MYITELEAGADYTRSPYSLLPSSYYGCGTWTLNLTHHSLCWFEIKGVAIPDSLQDVLQKKKL